ncbi:MAG: winged helix-turn-helix transcriptional regulator [Bacteroidia bacterium]|nr:winged helix-turn-helix transcriptional regulator [Bacteroidia bacterium]
MASIVDELRDFNRFYTGVIGLLDRHILDSRFSLPEARIMYELHHHGPCKASDIAAATGMDRGYLSRTLDRLIKLKIVRRAQSKEDGRASLLTLSAGGSRQFLELNDASEEQVKALLAPLRAKTKSSFETLCNN